MKMNYNKESIIIEKDGVQKTYKNNNHSDIERTIDYYKDNLSEYNLLKNKSVKSEIEGLKEIKLKEALKKIENGLELIIKKKGLKYSDKDSYIFTEEKFAVDLSILIKEKDEYNDVTIKIPLIERKYDPKGFAFPGGFIDEGESKKIAALREATEEVNFDSKDIDISQVEEVQSFSGRDTKGNYLSNQGIRDPRSGDKGSVSTTLFKIDLNEKQSIKAMKELKAGDDARRVKLYSFEEILIILENDSFAQGHGELLIKIIDSIPEFKNRYKKEISGNPDFKHTNSKFVQYEKSQYEKRPNYNNLMDDKCIIY